MNFAIILKSFVFLDTVIEDKALKCFQLKEFRFLDGNGELYDQKLITS